TSTLGRRKDVTDDRERESHHHAAANTLCRTKHDQLIHAVETCEIQFSRGAAKSGCHDEARGPAEKEPLAAVDIGKLCKNRNSNRRTQQIRGRHPRITVKTGK